MPEKADAGPGDDEARQQKELDQAALEAEFGHTAEHLLPPRQATIEELYRQADQVLQDPRTTCNRATDFTLGDGMFISVVYEEPNRLREESRLIALGRAEEGSENPILIADFYPPDADLEDPDSDKPIAGEVYDMEALRQIVERAQAHKLPQQLLNALQAFLQVEDDTAELEEVARGALELGRSIPRDQATRVARELYEEELLDGSAVTIMHIKIQDRKSTRQQLSLEQTHNQHYRKFEMEGGRPPLFADVQGATDDELADLSEEEREEDMDRRHELLLLEIDHGMQEATEEQAQWAIKLLNTLDATP
jgi:hypothetical protein